MSQHSNRKPLSLAIGTAFAASLAAGSVGAAENPFQQAELASGYMVADAHEGKCGEGKCGGKKDKDRENCDKDKKGKAEGKCGEGKCGGKKDKAEGKCGEGKCGGNQ
ncbi:uncharacterized protein FOKN1_0963 [Thiohalobacter thiocyanaticus]|uniref:Low-complexity protein n=1 Tax=Thiohalobacter thiocyanaticus TaxID=585455 RepID=A0A1Z4VPD7_9GAMM|nr:hypothetical protein [Thiohalobacter thiocyanaticus]BAZ93363.1 uncharacterized protein FOKN1_0963 [Thiohalobacter thiocyanaticus]